MPPLTTLSSDTTRQFLQAMCAQVHGQLALERMAQQPGQALQAQANISLQSALALLRD